jgi:glutamyl-tRNA synthetase
MEIFENTAMGPRLVPDELGACSRSLHGPQLSPKADGRFAPSPTGSLHLGNLRTALLAWLFARSARARFRVRVEDLDRSRVRPDIEEAQLADLRAIGLNWNGPVVRQSERIPFYEEAIARLDSDGHLYPCYCTRAEIRASASTPHGIFAADRYPGNLSRALRSRACRA